MILAFVWKLRHDSIENKSFLKTKYDAGKKYNSPIWELESWGPSPVNLKKKKGKGERDGLFENIFLNNFKKCQRF